MEVSQTLAYLAYLVSFFVVYVSIQSVSIIVLLQLLHVQYQHKKKVITAEANQEDDSDKSVSGRPKSIKNTSLDCATSEFTHNLINNLRITTAKKNLGKNPTVG